LTRRIAILILALAAASMAGLWGLVRFYRHSLHVTTAQSVLDWGQLMVRQLADQPALREGTPPGADAWIDFDRWVRSLGQVEPGLQYVSVSERGQLIYQRQPESIAETASPGAPRIDRQLIAQGTGVVPVLTFTLPVVSPGGVPRTVQVALRREVLSREESAAASAVEALFRMALGTILGAMAAAALLIAWTVRRETRRQEARREEEHLAFAGILADGIFHDLRNPLSSLKLDFQMMGREIERTGGPRPERLAELERRGRRTIDRVDALMEEFLLTAKPDREGPEPVDWNRCVRDALDLVQPHFENGGVRLQLELAADRPTVFGFPLALKRALINILVNARQAAPDGGTVVVRTLRLPTMAVTEVEDDGAGIPPSIRDRIFDGFVSGRPGGTGLGLSLARAAVEKSGGVIEVEDRTPRGTRIRLLLPLSGAVDAGGERIPS